MLRPDQLYLGLQVNFHLDYEQEEWKDGVAPLTIEDVYHKKDNDKKKEEYLVSYRCSDPNCVRCTKYNPSGHIISLREDGTCFYNKVIFTETRKALLLKEVKQPVFEKVIK